MASEDELRFRKFLSDTREKASKLIGLDHIDLDARNALKDFIEVSRQTEKLLSDRNDTGADQRVLQKRYDQLKTEHRELEKRAGKISEIVTTELAPVLKTITGDTILISERAKAITDEKHQKDVVDATVRIKIAVRKIVEVFTKL
ncbi:MAG: hypothetical protein V4760_05780 [Bdellovibrionota bacterium]